MKKRILALALAGTTAFSVFGAAMSANAAWIYWNGDESSHITANDGDYYVEYRPAGVIHWNAEDAQLVLADSDQTVYTNGYRAGDYEGQSYIPANTTLYVTHPDTFIGNDDYYTVKNVSTMSGYHASLNDYMASRNYRHVDIEGYAPEDVVFSESRVAEVAGAPYFRLGTGANAVTYYIYRNGNPDGYQYYALTAAQVANGDADHYQKADNLAHDPGNEANTADIFYTVNVNGVVASDVYVPDSWVDDAGGLHLNWNLEQFIGYSRSKPYYIADLAAAGFEVGTNYDIAPAGDWVVTAFVGAVDTVWTDMRYTALEDNVGTFDEIMDIPVQNGVVYLYDYYNSGSYPTWMSADEFSDGWADADLATRLGGSGEIWPEEGYSYRYIRGDVLDAWEDFLDDLGISDPSMTNEQLTLWAENTYENYLYTYYDANAITDVAYNTATGEWVIMVTSGKNVDVYNFADLIEDILDLSPSMNPDMNDTQTSELIYLMQQYEKYMDGFVDQVPVETDDWGDLLVALAEAPTEDEFSTTNAYKRYTNAVEDLVEQYVEADTAAAVKIAEDELYEFVTDYNSAYKYSTKADTTALYTAIDNTYFNAKWALVGEEYAREIADGELDNERWEAISDYTNAWALYPKNDYLGTRTGAYPGVADTVTVSGVNDSYFWFYNVYTLAYNVYADNKYQSTLDLMAETLNEAVANLVPTTNATASRVLAAEEQADRLADLIETDYDSAMWANRNKAYNHITERVSNDEIGPTGSSIATMAADETADLMGWQKFQTSVTRSEINNLKTSRTNAQTALTALRDDEDNYNAAQANALEKAIEDCDYIIAIYDGDYATFGSTQTVNGKYNGAVGDKDQILKSDITNAVEAVDAAINFSNIIQGWSQDEDGNWMYGTTEGYLNDGWHQVDGGKTWFYFDEDGTAKQSEWWQNPENGYWYWFNSNCGAAVGWAKIDGDWYFFKGDNHMKTGWEKVEGSWYYLASSGKMVTGWAQIDGKWYYFSKESNALGQMLTNTTTPDGYKVDANGVLVD